jgi:holliday junction resolvase Hjr
MERDLKRRLNSKGYYVVRASGSGADGISPDLIALHTTKKFGVECKAWKNDLRLRKEKIAILRDWERTTGMQVFVAWKLPRKKWRFFPLAALREAGKTFTLSKRDYFSGMALEDVS